MSELSSDPLERYAQLRADPWLFLKYCVFTQDEVDKENPIKPFPAHFLYAKFLVMMWLRENRLAIPKSRRMTASWTFIALATWDVLFHKGRSWAFCSKKEEDAKELVQRAEFIINHIPPTMIDPALLPKMKRGEMQTSPPVIDLGDIYSKIQGFPSGANQLRQRGFSGILNDECSFWENAEDAYASAEPTIKGGGKMVMISSRAIEDKGFFKRLVFDQLEAETSRFPEVPPVATKSPMEGVTVWKNPKNEFLIIDLHYTANPAKRGDAFRESLKKTLPIRKYRMEYEKSWETFEGKPVYEDFNELIHVCTTKPKLHVGLPVLIGWDSSGLTPAVVIGQIQGETLFIFKEIIGPGMGAKRFIPHVIEEMVQEFPQITDISAQTISFFDPAGFKKNEITEETYLHALMQAGFKKIRPGPMKWKARVEGVVNYLTGMTKGVPKFQVYDIGCPTLVAGLKGGFRYPDKVTEVEPDKAMPVKDIHSHPNDALQYMCGGLKSYRQETQEIDIKTPSYGFQKPKQEQDDKPKLRKRYV